MPKIETPKEKTTRKSRSRSKKAEANGAETPFLYPLPKSVFYTAVGAEGELGEMTIEEAKRLIGYEEETEEVKFASAYFAVNPYSGKKFRVRNNTRNRSFILDGAKAVAYDLLSLNWEFNGEPILVGKTGQVLSGQHRLLGFIFAEDRRNGIEAPKWKKYWKGPITVPVAVTFGIDENPKVTRTIDNVRSRTLADVLFTDPTVFGTVSAEERRGLVSAADSAIRFLWERLAIGARGVDVSRTHSESVGFLADHPKLLDAVRFVFEEDKGGGRDDRKRRVATYSPGKSLGRAAGLLFLFGAAKTVAADYYDRDRLTEDGIDFSEYEKAEEFFTLLATRDPDLLPLIEAIASAETEGAGGTPLERLALFVYAYDRFRLGKPIRKADLALEYETEPDGTVVRTELGRKVLNDFPRAPGIDRGSLRALEEDDEDKDEGGSSSPSGRSGPFRLTVESVAEAAARVRREALEATRDRPAEDRSKDPITDGDLFGRT